MSERLEAEFDTQGHVDEGTIHTWLDGAFDDDAASVVANHVEGCAHCRANVAEARGFVAGATRITRALDDVPSNVVPAHDIERAASRIVAAAATPATALAIGVSTHATSRTTSRSWYQSPSVRIAATLAIVVGGSAVAWNRVDPTVPASPVASFSTPSAKADARVAERPRTPGKARNEPMSAAISSTAISSAAKQSAPSGIANGISTSVAGGTARPASANTQGAGTASAQPAPLAVAVAADRIADRIAERTDDAARKKDASAVADTRELSGKVASMSVAAAGAGGRSSVVPPTSPLAPTAASLNAMASPARAERALGGLSAAPARQSCWTLALGDGAQASRLGVVVNDTNLVHATTVVGTLLAWPTSTQSASAIFTVEDSGDIRATAAVDGFEIVLMLTRQGGTWSGTAKQSHLNSVLVRTATLIRQEIGVCK